MKTRNLFIALVLLSVGTPTIAQYAPERNPQTDPKEVYVQDFEDDWDDWTNTPIDTINGLDYFLIDRNYPGYSVKIWDNPAWQKGFLHRDTIIYLYNNVILSDAETDFLNDAFHDDLFTITADASAKYFRYISGDGSRVRNYSGGSVPEYRRNLYLRLTPGAIEENSSYRVTMYVKTSKMTNEMGEKNLVNAKFRAELMRGYYESDKGISMGRDVSSSKTFYYEKNDFKDGEWEKITFMTYYLDADIANGFCYYNQYYDEWCDYWKWKGDKVTNAGYDSLCIIRQPDKFFLRMSFRSDSTIFDVDNVSVTRSSIGGIEHAGNMLRVDFGYQTNLKDLALAAKEQTNVPIVEIPSTFFTVKGYKASTDRWQNIGISTAEYHDDGYLYMWAKPGAGGTQIKFENYDSVLVSFTNPTGEGYENLSLKYTGTLYPNALDEAWVNAGMKVFDFTNEVSTPNPNIADGVYQMKNYPPVLRPNGVPYEDGAFGLNPGLGSIKLIMSRKLDIDPDDVNGTGDKALCLVFKDGVKVETWPATESTDTYTTFTRQTYSPIVSGDYTFKFVQIRGVGDSNYSDDIVLNYHFGVFENNQSYYFKSNWRSEITLSDEEVWDRPTPTSLYTWNVQDGFYQGTGTNFSPYRKNGLYKMIDDGVHGDCFFSLSSRRKGELGTLYTVASFDAGRYNISFPAFCNGKAGMKTTVYVYPKPDEMEYDALTMADKTAIGSFEPDYQKTINGNNVELNWTSDITGAKFYDFNFVVPANGQYVIEWSFELSSTTNYYSVCIGNYTLLHVSDLSSKYVSMVNYALSKADTKIFEIDNNYRKYKGSDYNAFVTYIADMKANAFNENEPSVYIANTQAIYAATEAMQNRMDTVDMFYTALDNVNDELNTNISFTGIDAYDKLAYLRNTYNSYDCSLYSGEQILNTVNLLCNGIDNLNTRIAKMNGYDELLYDTRHLLDSSLVLYDDPYLSGRDFKEYRDLQATYLNAFDLRYNIGTMSDDEFYELYDGILLSTKALLYAMDEVAARTRQARELYSTAIDLGCYFGTMSDEIYNRIASLRTRDLQLEDVLRKAVILQIYRKYSDCTYYGWDFYDVGYDVSCLIPNYYLYNEGVVDENMEEKNGVWCVKDIVQGNTTVIPDWTISDISTESWSGSRGYWLPTTVKVGDGKGYIDWPTDGRAFAGGLRCAPQTKGKVEMTNPVEIPAGLYFIGMYGYNQTSNVQMIVESDYGILGDNDEKSLNNVFNPYHGKFQYREVGVDSVMIGGETKIMIYQHSSSSSEFDMRNFILHLSGPMPNFDYYSAAIEAENDLNLALSQLEPTYTPDPVVTETHRMYMDNVSGMAGNEIVIPINMENTRYITAFSLDVKLPSGMTFVNASLNSGRNNGHSLYRNVTTVTDGSVVSLACLSLNNNCLYGNDGTVVNLTVRLSNDMEGDYNIQLGNIEMTAEPTQKYTPATYTGCVSVQARFEPGDVNEDGSISITDAVGVVAFIINSQTQGLNRSAADANQDGTIDVADAVWIVNKIIRKSYSFAPARFSVSGEISSVLTMDDIMVADKMSIPVRIEGMPNEITALQFNLTLPENLSIKEVVTDQDHMIATQKQQDGSYMVICLSMNNATFIGNGNAALELKLVSDKLKAKGDVVLDNIIMVTPDGRKKECGAVTGRLTSGGETGIPDIDADSNYDMYDIQGRTIDRANGIYIRNGKKLMQIK